MTPEAADADYRALHEEESGEPREGRCRRCGEMEALERLDEVNGWCEACAAREACAKEEVGHEYD
jgi:hypothetical protein